MIRVKSMNLYIQILTSYIENNQYLNDPFDWSVGLLSFHSVAIPLIGISHLYIESLSIEISALLAPIISGL